MLNGVFNLTLQLVQAQTALAQAEKERDVFRDKLNAAEATIADHRVKHKQADEILEKRRSIILGLRKQVASLTEEYGYARQAMRDDQHTISRLHKEIADLKSSPERRIDRLESLLVGLTAQAAGVNLKVEVNNAAS